MNEIFIQQEVFWKQRSKQLWLREGDKIEKKIHATAMARRKSNYVQRLINADGKEVDWEGGLEGVMVDYFNSLFKVTDTSWEPVVSCITHKVSANHNAWLQCPVEDSEVKRALLHMYSEKSPGSDGMSPGFYQK